MVNFLIKNIGWFVGAFVILLLAVIGSFAEKKEKKKIIEPESKGEQNDVSLDEIADIGENLEPINDTNVVSSDTDIVLENINDDNYNNVVVDNEKVDNSSNDFGIVMPEFKNIEDAHMTLDDLEKVNYEAIVNGSNEKKLENEVYSDLESHDYDSESYMYDNGMTNEINSFDVNYENNNYVETNENNLFDESVLEENASVEEQPNLEENINSFGEDVNSSNGENSFDVSFDNVEDNQSFDDSLMNANDIDTSSVSSDSTNDLVDDNSSVNDAFSSWADSASGDSIPELTDSVPMGSESGSLSFDDTDDVDIWKF